VVPWHPRKCCNMFSTTEAHRGVLAVVGDELLCPRVRRECRPEPLLLPPPKVLGGVARVVLVNAQLSGSHVTQLLMAKPLVTLTHLDLSRNYIKELPLAHAWATMVGLTSLNLSHNSVCALPERLGPALPSLTALNLRSNHLRPRGCGELQLSGFGRLEVLDLRFNVKLKRLGCDELMRWIPTLDRIELGDWDSDDEDGHESTHYTDGDSAAERGDCGHDTGTCGVGEPRDGCPPHTEPKLRESGKNSGTTAGEGSSGVGRGVMGNDTVARAVNDGGGVSGGSVDRVIATKTDPSSWPSLAEQLMPLSTPQMRARLFEEFEVDIAAHGGPRRAEILTLLVDCYARRNRDDSRSTATTTAVAPTGSLTTSPATVPPTLPILVASDHARLHSPTAASTTPRPTLSSSDAPATSSERSNINTVNGEGVDVGEQARPTTEAEGILLPPELMSPLLKALRRVQWAQERPKVTAEGYLVLERTPTDTRRGVAAEAKRGRYEALWAAAAAVMESTDPAFASVDPSNPSSFVNSVGHGC
jgi:hypothetical protein